MKDIDGRELVIGQRVAWFTRQGSSLDGHVGRVILVETDRIQVRQEGINPHRWISRAQIPDMRPFKKVWLHISERIVIVGDLEKKDLTDEDEVAENIRKGLI